MSLPAILGLLSLVLLSLQCLPCVAADNETSLLSWEELPPIPDALGVAGPFVGVHEDALIVAGGANFPEPVWDNSKRWHDRIYVCTREEQGDRAVYSWRDVAGLPKAIAYGASVSTPHGLVCMGGNDSEHTFDQVFLLSWNPTTAELTSTPYPRLPSPCAYGAATLVGDRIFLAGGQSGSELETAMTNFWSLDLSVCDDPAKFVWTQLPAWPGRSRAFNLTVNQHNGYDDCVYVISGRTERPVSQSDLTDQAERYEFLRDVWEYTPATNAWRRRRDVPRCVMAGTGLPQGQSHIFVLGGATEALFFQTDQLRDSHPGFIRQSLAYHTITDTWIEAGPTPANHVTTTAVQWGDAMIVASGEVRPRVRSARVYRVTVNKAKPDFGWINYCVLIGYLLSMVAIGFYCSRKNTDTDDFFRGGSRIPWWAAGCSIFATMLSSLTFTGIPSKAYAQDWVYAIGNFMIPPVAVIAVYVAMPFFRRIDATSAYEYLEKRFDWRLRMIGSASFAVFHIFRMAVVMSLTGLALAVASPLTPTESVLLMGVLSIAYCTLGGIEAVIWTDTIQTFVLLGGAFLAIALLVSGTSEGVVGFRAAASEAGKFNFANLHWSPTSTQIALWVIVVGAIGQNLSSYTADQAVVQRYMTTASTRLAARSIWTNALLSIPATFLFFGIGTALFTYYQSHPEKLDPSITTDQVFPLFIARELPIGLSGLMVAAIFAAAQSTVSTSMNSTATSIVTDFLRPWNCCRSERRYLAVARLLTLAMGGIGTGLGLVFIDPDIKSLFDAFIIVIGLFMGVLGGLFVLGGTTVRANGTGALIGAIAGAATTLSLWAATPVNGYLFTSCGMIVCCVVGYATSMLTNRSEDDLTGLTIHTLPLNKPAVDG